MVATLGRLRKRYAPPRRAHVLAVSLFLLSCGALFTLRVSFTADSIAGGAEGRCAAAPHADRVNATLRRLAEIDEGEPDMARQAFLLLEALGSPPSFLQRLLGLAQEDWLEAARLRLAREGVRLPAGLARHADRGRWAAFRSAARAWLRARRHDALVMRALLRGVGTPVSAFHRGSAAGSAGPAPYESCAVVGNSGILLNRTYGALIDAHALVVRLNNAPTSGFHRHVGSRTHVAFLNSHVLRACTSGSRPDRCFCHAAYGRPVPVVVYVCQLVHFLDVLTCSHPSLGPLPPTLVTDPRLDILAARIAKYYSLARFVHTTGRLPEEWSAAHDGPMFHYSSGFQAVLLALGICNRVGLFGFGKLPGSKHHYHTGQEEELHLHDYLAEYQFYEDLANNDSSIIPFLSNSNFLLPPVHIYI